MARKIRESYDPYREQEILEYQKLIDGINGGNFSYEDGVAYVKYEPDDDSDYRYIVYDLRDPNRIRDDGFCNQFTRIGDKQRRNVENALLNTYCGSEVRQFMSENPSEDEYGEVYESLSPNSKALDKIIRLIYKTIQPYTSKMYRDDNWSGVGNFCDLVRTVPGVNNAVLGHGEYTNFLEPDKGSSKSYIMEIETDYGMLYGRVTCSAAGTVDNPFGMYDISMTVGKYRPNELNEDRRIIHESVVKAFKKHGLLNEDDEKPDYFLEVLDEYVKEYADNPRWGRRTKDGSIIIDMGGREYGGQRLKSIVKTPSGYLFNLEFGQYPYPEITTKYPRFAKALYSYLNSVSDGTSYSFFKRNGYFYGR